VARCLRQGASLVAPYYQGRRGHPVGIARHFYAELTRLQGNQGARGLLERYHDQVNKLIVSDPGVVRDVDRPED